MLGVLMGKRTSQKTGHRYSTIEPWPIGEGMIKVFSERYTYKWPKRRTYTQFWVLPQSKLQRNARKSKSILFVSDRPYFMFSLRFTVPLCLLAVQQYSYSCLFPFNFTLSSGSIR